MYSSFRPAAFLRRKWQQIQMRYYAYRNPEKLVKIRYRQRFGVDPDLKNPRTRNEKVLWMMLYSDITRWSQLADKYRVRAYVEQCGLGWMLNEQYAMWESADQIDFDDPRLPDSFVLKTNNGYGEVVFVHDRKTADRKAIRRKLAHALSRKFGRMSGEHHYLAIKPCIIAEKLLVADAGPKSSLVDYKFYCFDGEPRYCVVVYDQLTPSSTTEELYEAQTWKDLNHKILGFDRVSGHRHIPRPASLDKMLDAARRLSAGFPLVRVDLYEIAGEPVFGELTFSPAAGTDKTYGPEFQREMGDWITLPPAKRTYPRPLFPGLLPRLRGLAAK